MFIFLKSIPLGAGQTNKSQVWISGIQILGKKATMLGLLDKLKKITFSPSSASGLEIPQEKCIPSLIPVVLHTYNSQNDRLGPSRVVFQLNRRGAVGIKLGVHFSSLFPSSDTEVRSDLEIFQNSSVQPSTAAFFGGLWSLAVQYTGGGILPPKQPHKKSPFSMQHLI